MQFKVLADDDGIRPAGRPDECFYCRSRVGQMHGPECVMITRESKYAVIIDGVRWGIFTTDDPADWSDDSCNFHKNESSWCVDNIDGPGYVGEPLPELPEDRCLCHRTELVLLERSVAPRRTSG